jgi:hypothetical protein
MDRYRRYATGRPVTDERLAKRSTEPLVTLQELEEACRLPPGSGFSKLAAMRVKVVGDWAGRPSVSLEDAAKVYAKATGDLQEQEQKWQHYQAYVETRQRELQAARSTAAAEARKGVSGTPQQEGRAQAAAHQAQQQFEAEHPLQTFEEFRPGGDGT